MKKRISMGLLLLALLLAGCRQDLPAGTQPDATVETTQPTQPPVQGLYQPDSPLERKTFGAIHTYSPERDHILGITAMADRLLVVYGGDGDAVELALYEGEDCVPVCSVMVADSFRLDSAAVHITDSTVSYYDESRREAVLMGEDLVERERVLLPEEMVGEPAIASDFSQVFYSTGSEIRALDLKTGITRLLRTVSGQTITLQAVCFGDVLLQCAITEEDGSSFTAFLSAETGETVGQDGELLSFSAMGSHYYLQRRNASVVEQIYGTYGEDPRALDPAGKVQTCYSLTGIAGALAVTPLEDRGLNLDVYDLTSGRRTANVVLPDYQAVTAPAADPAGENIWFAVSDASGTTLLCRWELDESTVSNDADYTSIRYTRDTPDTEGLAQCQARADALGEQYGIEISLMDEDIRMPSGYTAVSEYQTAALEYGLDALEKALARFPEDFFTQTASVTSDKRLHISLVQSITNMGDGHAVGGLQYWIEGQEYISLAIYEMVEQNFYHELCHALDTFLYANSGVLDAWEDLNPADFQYDNNFQDYLNRESTPYLEGETRAFADSYSMTYPMEDRARLFEYAMTDGAGEMFEAPAMQAKLKLLCKAIRDAFGWKEDPRQFPWEQYLT